MKLASLKNGTRDGALCVVSRDLKYATVAYDIAPTLQAALDDWDYCAPLLGTLYEEANRHPQGSRWFAFDMMQATAPLPRAFQWIGACSYLSHMERLRKASGAAMPGDGRKEPWLLQGRSDAFLGARDDVGLMSPDLGLDLGGEIAVITDDVPQGIKREKAGEHIRLFVVVNDWTARNSVSDELTCAAGRLHNAFAIAFSAVAITPDELGSAWDGRRIHLPLEARVNDQVLGAPDTGQDMHFDFPALIAAAARLHALGAGTIIGSGIVSNRDTSTSVCSIAEKRALEALEGSEPLTDFLRVGDRVSIELVDTSRNSLFGRIEQNVTSVHTRRKPSDETTDADLSEALDTAT